MSDKRDKLLKRYNALPKHIRDFIAEDLETAFENRVKVMEKICEQRGL